MTKIKRTLAYRRKKRRKRRKWKSF